MASTFAISISLLNCCKLDCAKLALAAKALAINLLTLSSCSVFINIPQSFAKPILSTPLQSLISQSNMEDRSLVFSDEYVITRYPVYFAHSGIHRRTTHSDQEKVELFRLSPSLEKAKSFLQDNTQTSAFREIKQFKRSDNKCPDIKKADPSIKSCSPNFLRHRLATPNDWYFNQQWHLAQTQSAPSQSVVGVDAERAWDHSTGSKDIVVGIVDGGLDYNHPDLAENLWVNPDEIPNNGIDDDNNGYIDDVFGINSESGLGTPFSNDIHGTHVAGIIGASGNNAIGVSGVNWQVSLLNVNGADRDGYFSVYSIARGLDYIRSVKTKKGFNVVAINASFGGYSYSQVEMEAIKRLKEAEIIFVAASGNEKSNIDRLQIYPASYQLDNIISVLASEQSGEKARFSNYGVINSDIAAPGTDILSTFPNGLYGRLEGTSMATPLVTGAIALAASARPDLLTQRLRSLIFSTATPLANLEQVTSTGRLLNIGNLMESLVSPPIEGQSRLPKALVRNINYQSKFAAKSGRAIGSFNRQRKLTIPIFGDKKVPSGSTSTMYIQFRINKRSCNGYIKISNIQESSFSIRVPVPTSKRVAAIGVQLKNGEGQTTFISDIKRFRKLRKISMSKQPVSSACNSLTRLASLSTTTN